MDDGCGAMSLLCFSFSRGFRPEMPEAWCSMRYRSCVCMCVKPVYVCRVYVEIIQIIIHDGLCKRMKIDLSLSTWVG